MPEQTAIAYELANERLRDELDALEEAMKQRDREREKEAREWTCPRSR